jgi:ADP-ribosylglycohydrolase
MYVLRQTECSARVTHRADSASAAAAVAAASVNCVVVTVASDTPSLIVSTAYISLNTIVQWRAVSAVIVA